MTSAERAIMRETKEKLGKHVIGVKRLKKSAGKHATVLSAGKHATVLSAGKYVNDAFNTGNLATCAKRGKTKIWCVLGVFVIQVVVRFHGFSSDWLRNQN